MIGVLAGSIRQPCHSKALLVTSAPGSMPDAATAGAGWLCTAGATPPGSREGNEGLITKQTFFPKLTETHENIRKT